MPLMADEPPRPLPRGWKIRRLAAGFKEQNPKAGILAQACRQSAAGRSRPDDNEVRCHGSCRKGE